MENCVSCVPNFLAPDGPVNERRTDVVGGELTHRNLSNSNCGSLYSSFTNCARRTGHKCSFSKY